MIDFKPLSSLERKQLTTALRGNSEQNRAILMDKRDTSFIGSAADEVTDEEVINAIKSVPCHY